MTGTGSPRILVPNSSGDQFYDADEAVADEIISIFSAIDTNKDIPSRGKKRKPAEDPTQPRLEAIVRNFAILKEKPDEMRGKCVETLDVSVPLKQGSDRPETSPNNVSDDSLYFIC